MKTARLAALAALLTTAAPAAFAAEVELRLAHWLPPTHPVQTLAIEPWVESIKEASNGRINITVFPASQLGAAPDHYDMTRDGIADFGYVNPGYQAGRFPIYGLAEIPFHVKEVKNGSADTRYVMETHDGALIDIRNFGYRHGPPEVLEALARGDTVDPLRYYMRTQPRLETGDARYAWLNRTVFAGTGERLAAGVRITFFEVT